MTATAIEPYFTAKGQMSGHALILDDVTLAVLWDRVSQFGNLFATEEEMSFPVFRDWLEDKGTLVIGLYHADEREPVGLGMVYGILGGVDVKIQISFFDGKFEHDGEFEVVRPDPWCNYMAKESRAPIVRAFVGWVFDTVKVRRISVHLPHHTLGMQRFLQRVGMVAEGRLKDWVRKDGTFLDLYLFGLSARECDEHWRDWRSSAKPRVRVIKQKSVNHGQGVPKQKQEVSYA